MHGGKIKFVVYVYKIKRMLFICVGKYRSTEFVENDRVCYLYIYICKKV